MSNYKDNKKYGFNNESSSSKNITQNRKKSPVEDKYIEIIGTRPAIGIILSPIGRIIEFAQTHRLNNREKGLYFQYFSVSSSTNDYRGKNDA